MSHNENQNGNAKLTPYTRTEDAPEGTKVKPVRLNPTAKLSPEDRNAFLATSHELYAVNQHVRFEGKWLTFERPEYHKGMAALYLSKN